MWSPTIIKRTDSELARAYDIAQRDRIDEPSDLRIHSILEGLHESRMTQKPANSAGKMDTRTSMSSIAVEPPTSARPILTTIASSLASSPTEDGFLQQKLTAWGDDFTPRTSKSDTEAASPPSPNGPGSALSRSEADSTSSHNKPGSFSSCTEVASLSSHTEVGSPSADTEMTSLFEADEGDKADADSALMTGALHPSDPHPYDIPKHGELNTTSTNCRNTFSYLIHEQPYSILYRQDIDNYMQSHIVNPALVYHYLPQDVLTTPYGLRLALQDMNEYTEWDDEMLLWSIMCRCGDIRGWKSVVYPEDIEPYHGKESEYYDEEYWAKLSEQGNIWDELGIVDDAPEAGLCEEVEFGKDGHIDCDSSETGSMQGWTDQL